MNGFGQLELSDMQPLAAPGSLFEEGFSLPWRQQPAGTVPWTTVQQLLAMARDALRAKQQAAEALMKEIEQIRNFSNEDMLLQRAQRAEVDSRLLLEELQGLMQAKADVAQQRADLNRANALLMAERELLCEQLEVSPDKVNLCQAVQKVLAAAKRARGLEGQLRLLARSQRELLLQLEATREQEARAAGHWQACEQVYLATLTSHGIPKPELPASSAQQRTSCSSIVADSHSSSSSSAGGLSSAGSQEHQQLLMQLGSGSAAAAGADTAAAVLVNRRLSAVCTDGCVGSPASHGHLLPPTPPASDLNIAGTPRHLTRRHSLDSGLHSLTGLLDQLALGQLGMDDSADDEYDNIGDNDEDGESWMFVDSMSDDHQLASVLHAAAEQSGDAAAGPVEGVLPAEVVTSSVAGESSAAAAAAALVLLGGSSSACGHGHARKHLLQRQVPAAQSVAAEEQVGGCAEALLQAAV